MNEFDKELDRLLLQHGAEQGSLHEALKRGIKQAVDRYVIGEPIDYLDVGALTGRGDNCANEVLTATQAATLITHNHLLFKQRQSLWGKRNG